MSGEIYIYPTDTVWGIGGNIFDEKTYKRISEIKRTSPDKPLSILFSSFDMLKEYIRIPESLSEQWMLKYFSLEATLGLPIKSFKVEMPEWTYQKSEFLLVRIIDKDFTQELVNKVNGPITTTSLNITGRPPCVKKEEAFNFFNSNCPEANFIDTDEIHPSGHSSTITLFDGSDFKIVREGFLADEIRDHIGILTA